jgi:hypothetical protein
MRKFLLALALISVVSPAMADPYHHRYQPPPRHHGGGNAGAWVAGAVGLGLLGAIIANESRPRCTEELIGYDRFGNEVWKRYCN